LDPQDVVHTTDDLERALRSSGVNGPYLLVGHSSGSYETLRFADLHPEEVVGMVLVDPSFPGQDRRLESVVPNFFRAISRADHEAVLAQRKCAADLRSGKLALQGPDPNNCFDYPAEYPPDLLDAMKRLDSDPNRQLTQASLLDQVGASSEAIVNSKRDYGNMPIRILTSGEARPPKPGSMPEKAISEYPAFRREWLQSHEAMAKASTDGSNQIVANSRHFIQELKPEVVISTVEEVIEKARASR
jgi:pimeloyl-ACP methyl ester carboxylesterase